MRKVTVRKISEYSPLIPKMTKYDSYNLIVKQEYSPGILKRASVINPVYDGIFSSDLRRGVESSNLYLSKKPTILLSDLREIKFSLKSLLSENEYSKFGSNLVRERFVLGFERNRLLESRKVIKGRLLAVIKKLNDLPSGKYLVISHSFFMKIMDIYIHMGDLFADPSILRDYFNPTKKTYNFNEGFTFEL